MGPSIFLSYRVLLTFETYKLDSDKGADCNPFDLIPIPFLTPSSGEFVVSSHGVPYAFHG